MTEKELTIEAKPREVFGKQNQKLRKAGTLPAVLYGKGKESQHLEVVEQDFRKAYRQAGENTLVDLAVEGQKPVKVLIYDVAQHYMSNQPIHVDFYEVDLTKKIRAHIPLHFVGISAAVKELGGTLVKNMSEVEVDALPTDLPHFIEVDISSLATFENIIRIKDLKVSDKVEIMGHEEDAVASVQEPRSEEELEALEAATTEEAEAEAIAAVAGEKEEGEEGTEGEEGKKEEKEEKGEKKEAPEEKAKKEEKK